MADVDNPNFKQVHHALIELFELVPEDVVPDANLYEDLVLDSIDAVDLVVHLQKEIGKKIPPEVFKSVRTVQDVVDAIEQLLQPA
ncbi:acyl carrier protein [Enterovibrio norvegicus FF-33]|uniref:Acyl carrier protein n=1 Tax=Enterovibrio norvegicus FF-454 TaxID=1185651 RepID=A0A1E5C861_9GAMM|nr:acyl carrier protein [Enterovibrio norvegicus]OEE61698.1 acyl carrier protein [Enterovibrio norvegicus FF-454]OEE66495.1 acyl carrier protein [Enterovibrio norvegicus FF-33]OEE88814.1 acyl carrier protein [Enterovibrio norvegicus FF-162]